MYHVLFYQEEKNILPEDSRIVTVETCRTAYKCNCAVVGFIRKLHNISDCKLSVYYQNPNTFRLDPATITQTACFYIKCSYILMAVTCICDKYFV
jgi:hypothetical protein